MNFVSRQSIEKYIKEKTGTKVSVSRTPSFFNIHYVNSNRNVEKFTIKCNALDSLKPYMISKFVEKINADLCQG